MRKRKSSREEGMAQEKGTCKGPELGMIRHFKDSG
jgi:hypothetical protein